MGLRSFLFLQGTATPFFAALAKKLGSIGCHYYRVNFCGGDSLFSKDPDDWDYTDSPDNFSKWLSEKLETHRITDIVLFGDARPMHAQAIKLASANNITVHVFEEGYLRPHWLTLEQGGANANSSLSKNPQWYLDHANTIPNAKSSKPTGYQLKVRAWHDVRYHLSSFLQRQRFPYYRTHRPRNPLHEYYGWALRFPTLLIHERRDKKKIAELVASGDELYVFPLQLNADVQIRIHSPYANVKKVVKEVLTSFSQYAPTHSKIIIKNHPLDTGLEHYAAYIKQLEKKLGITGRVVYLETGFLPTLLDVAKGTVLVNSTVGMSALYHKCPTCVLGTAIYDLPGLTFQGGLNQFWKQGEIPDIKLYQAFSKVVIQKTQINGDFYSEKGISMAVDACVERFSLAEEPPLVATNHDSMPIEAASSYLVEE